MAKERYEQVSGTYSDTMDFGGYTIEYTVGVIGDCHWCPATYDDPGYCDYSNVKVTDVEEFSIVGEEDDEVFTEALCDAGLIEAIIQEARRMDESEVRWDD